MVQPLWPFAPTPFFPLPRFKELYSHPYLLLAFSPLCWAGNQIVGRAVRGEIAPLSLNWSRWAVAVIVLLAISGPIMARQRGLLMKHWKLVLILAATGILGFHSAVYIGLTETTAIHAGLIIAMGPALILPLSRLLLGDRFTWLQGLGVTISSLGVLAVITNGHLETLLSLAFNRGDLWLLLASLLWGLYSVLLKRKPAEVDVMALTTAVVLVGLLLTTPFFLWDLAQGSSIAPTAANLGRIAFIGIFAGAIAYIAWNRGVNAVGPNKAGLFLHLMPLYGAALATLFLGETLHLYHLGGFILIVSGLLLTARFGPRQTETRIPQ